MERQFRFAMAAATLAIIATLAGRSFAAEVGSCLEQYEGGRAPALINLKLKREAVPLCFAGFATLYSGLSRTPLYSAEHLTADRIARAETMIRADRFHPEPRLPDTIRSELSDYRGSGYDRGHMAPNGDMPDDASQSDSFSLANIAPQDHDDNAGLWAAIESTVRNMALGDGEVYVVTGPLFEGADIESLQGRVLVPTGLWKAVYDPISGEAGAYVVDNRPGNDFRTISIAELEGMTGMDPFPGLPAPVKAAAPDLAPPLSQDRRHRHYHQAAIQ